MAIRFERLAARAQRGSKPRCHILTEGTAEEVAHRLSELAAPHAKVTPADSWMPRGFTDIGEPELDKAARLLDASIRQTLSAWWLPSKIPDARTPNFDIASTCMIDSRKGLLLVEAKAHREELRKEAAGRKIKKAKNGERSVVNERRRLSHGKIGGAIEEARIGLSAETHLPWAISRDMAYQMSNRFAWAWKLTQLGFPVVLIYLGFLGADEMADQSEPFQTAEGWQREVFEHSAAVPAGVWGKRWTVGGQPFIAAVKSMRISL